MLNALWNYPTAFAGALQAVNAYLATVEALPPWISVAIAALVAAGNYAVVSPAKPRTQ
jgi:hypothetical protein